MFWKDSCFPVYRKVSTEVYIYENVGEKSAAKSYHPVGPLSVLASLLSASYWKSKKQKKKKRKRQRDSIPEGDH